MGWGGGTEIFDTMACELRNLSWDWVRDSTREEFMEPLEVLYQKLRKLDWDIQQESRYWDDPIIGKILGNKFEEGSDE